MSAVVLDATPLDTGHRTRGLGRYVQGLVQGFVSLQRAGDLAVDLRLLRLPGATDPEPVPFSAVPFGRRVRHGAALMHLENRLVLDRALPDDTGLYHATAMEGISRKKPWVATCHDLIPVLLRGRYLRPWAVKERLFWQEYQRLLRTDARRVIAISEHTRQVLVERANVDPDRIEVVYHGLTAFWFEPADVPTVAPEVRAAAAEPFILFVGGFDRRKNFRTLIKALAAIPRSERPRLLVAGKRSPTDRREHRLLLTRHRIDVQFFEYISDDDLRYLYHRARCLAFPSIEEGWGFPIVEAMAVGTPVVCAPYGSMVEAAGGAALTCEVRDAGALADTLRRAVADESLRQAHIDRGRRRASELTWESAARRVQDVYCAALGAA